MDERGPVIIAGAGIAGLTAALAFAAQGRPVRLFERAPKLEEIGAGLQLSPNATRILDRLGVLEVLRPCAVEPEAIVLRNGRRQTVLARIPLGQHATRRWGAPYLVAHRADLQRALLECVSRREGIHLETDAELRNVASRPDGTIAAVEIGGKATELKGQLLIGADGVGSAARKWVQGGVKSQFIGELAWRTTIACDSPAAKYLMNIGADRVVTAFLHPAAHLIVYPVRGGSAVNLVAFTRGERVGENWSGAAEAASLYNAFRGAAAGLIQVLQEAGPWTVWPLHTVDPTSPWTDPSGIALIGDAAHAMTPFAAQGAAMAIEDAATLAISVAAHPSDLNSALASWERKRRPRVLRVARRGAINRFAWHAAGPIAAARNLFLKLRSPEKLAADLDWLYGWDDGQAPGVK
jgi:salicylate hydroxylase